MVDATVSFKTMTTHDLDVLIFTANFLVRLWMILNSTYISKLHVTSISICPFLPFSNNMVQGMKDIDNLRGQVQDVQIPLEVFE